MSSSPAGSPFQSEARPRPTFPGQIFILARGLAGALAGALLGYLVFRWLARQGFYGIMIPGALLGLGAGLAARGKSQLLGVLCGLAGIIVGVVVEWSLFPFVKDGSFPFFIAHLHELPPVKLIMMGLGAACAYWFGQGR